MQIGIDIVKVSRFEDASDKLLAKIFTEKELERKKPETLAGKFAAKEAIKKADNSLFKNWTDVEILNDKSGKPYPVFSNKALDKKEEGKNPNGKNGKKIGSKKTKKISLSI